MYNKSSEYHVFLFESLCFTSALANAIYFDPYKRASNSNAHYTQTDILAICLRAPVQIPTEDNISYLMWHSTFISSVFHIFIIHIRMSIECIHIFKYSGRLYEPFPFICCCCCCYSPQLVLSFAFVFVFLFENSMPVCANSLLFIHFFFGSARQTCIINC